jgi:hypothetical protein
MVYRSERHAHGEHNRRAQRTRRGNDDQERGAQVSHAQHEFPRDTSGLPATARSAPPSFDELRRSLRAHNRIPKVTRDVELEKVVGSVGRREGFDGSFMPLRAGAGEGWKRVDLAFHRVVDLLPVTL